jgi:hypothetical protein
MAPPGFWEPGGAKIKLRAVPIFGVLSSLEVVMLDVQFMVALHELVRMVISQLLHAFVICAVIAVVCCVNRSRAAGRIDKRYRY